MAQIKYIFIEIMVICPTFLKIKNSRSWYGISMPIESLPFPLCIYLFITVTSHECHSISNHRQRDCFPSSLFGLTPKLRIIGPLWRKFTGEQWFPLSNEVHVCHTSRVRQGVHLTLVIKVHVKPDTPCWWQMVISRRQDGWFNISVFRGMKWWTSVSCEFVIDHVIMVVIIGTTITVHYV